MVRLLKEALVSLFSPEEIGKVATGIDLVGDIAIIRILNFDDSNLRIIAETILRNMKNIRTVLGQSSPVEGVYRIRGLRHLAGENKTSTLYREHGALFYVDLSKVYFSPRLSFERNRIAEQVAKGENIVNMFAGVGTFSIIIAKMRPNCKIYSVEINPIAYELMVKNVRLNKVEGDVISILGDVREVIRQDIQGKADRILMPLPERSLEYVGSALEALKPSGGIIHLYLHIHASKGEEPLLKAQALTEEKFSRKFKLLSSRIVREVGPRWSQVVLDIKL